MTALEEDHKYHVQFWNGSQVLDGRWNAVPVPRPRIFIGHWPQDRDPAVIGELWAQLQETYGAQECKESRMFPSMQEVEWAEGKIGDVQALDDIAGTMGTPDNYRPRTCMGTDCLIDGASVMKRSRSSCGAHVRVTPQNSEMKKKLPCKQGASGKNLLDKQPRWFHQEYVESLINIGGFRVVVTTVSDANALRGRRCKVSEIFHTFDNQETSMLVSVLDERSDFVMSGGRTVQELKAFTVDVCEMLRARSDWKEHFETLEIGVRLDVGISSEQDGSRFFVNEIIRIFYGDLFSYYTASPYVGICKAIARAAGDHF